MSKKNRKPVERLAYDPDFAVPPGRTLAETIEAIGIDQKELAQRTGFTQEYISQIMQGKAAISPDAAIQFERVTRAPARFWNALESVFQERKARLESRQRLEAERKAATVDRESSD